jgi:hypothetical protein
MKWIEIATGLMPLAMTVKRNDNGLKEDEVLRSYN